MSACTNITLSILAQPGGSLSWPDCGWMPSSLKFTGGKTGLDQIRFYSPNSRSTKARRETPRRSSRRVIADHFREPSVFRCLRAFSKVSQVFLHILAGKLFWYWWRTTGAGNISASVSGYQLLHDPKVGYQPEQENIPAPQKQRIGKVLSVSPNERDARCTLWLLMNYGMCSNTFAWILSSCLIIRTS